MAQTRSPLPELPEHRHVPGQSARHPEGAFDVIRAQALRPTRSATASQNPAWRYGLRLLGAGYWWETHEVLEPVWMHAPPNAPERHMVQAVIQIANAALKYEMARPNAARRLCAMATSLVRAADSGLVMGLETRRVLGVINALRAGEEGDWQQGIVLD